MVLLSEQDHGRIQEADVHAGARALGVHDEVHHRAAIEADAVHVEEREEESDLQSGAAPDAPGLQISGDPDVGAARDRGDLAQPSRDAAQVGAERRLAACRRAAIERHLAREIARARADAAVLPGPEDHVQRGLQDESDHEPLLMVGVGPERADPVRRAGHPRGRAARPELPLEIRGERPIIQAGPPALPRCATLPGTPRVERTASTS